MSFYCEDELRALGFKSLGRDVRVSRQASIYNHASIEIGDHSRIDDFCVLSGKISIGRNVHIAVQCNLAGGEPGIVMDDFSGFAYGVMAFAQSDDYSGHSLTNPTVPDRYKKETKAGVHVGRHVIVGTASQVFPGVHLAEGCAVGAMTMVTKSTQPWMIYTGVPAKAIKARSRELLELERAYLSDESGGR